MTTVARARPESFARYLSVPIPVELVEDDGQGRAWLKLPEGWVKIVSMKNLWEIDGYQEREHRVIRMHFRVMTEHGRSMLVYQDLLDGKWYRQFTLGDAVGDRPSY